MQKQETQSNNGAARLTHNFRTWYGCNVEGPRGYGNAKADW